VEFKLRIPRYYQKREQLCAFLFLTVFLGLDAVTEIWPCDFCHVLRVAQNEGAVLSELPISNFTRSISQTSD
jgi:hypothetical protein